NSVRPPTRPGATGSPQAAVDGAHECAGVSGHLPDHDAEQALTLDPRGLLADRPGVVERPPLVAGVAVRGDGLLVVEHRAPGHARDQVGVAAGTGLLGELARGRATGRLPQAVDAAVGDGLPAAPVERQPDGELA